MDRYGHLYTEGTPFLSWANFYPRVIQTAQNFVRGFLGHKASELGTVVTVAATASPLALFDSLAPSDLCPNFKDGNGGTYGLSLFSLQSTTSLQEIATDWDAIYLPPITARLNALLSGNLTLTTSDVGIFPYLCGYESQITGILSPFCSTFTDAELAQYEYRQDLRYYYGTGPGTDLAAKMMLPFLNSLVGLLSEGPGVEGTLANGTTFQLPSILTAFLNDGQLTELTAASGVFDEQEPLSGTSMDPNRKYVSSRFVTMRGTIAFERLSCKAPQNPDSPSTLTTSTKPTVCASATPTTQADCHHDNCLRQFLQSTSQVSSFCATYTAFAQPTATALPPYVSQCANSPARISSACSCVVPAATCAPTPTGSSTAAATPTPSSAGRQSYVRILLNDAVYPVPSCRDGPGGSCLMSKYAEMVKAKLEDAGDLKEQCGVTTSGGPSPLKGASFFTDLSSPWLATVAP